MRNLAIACFLVVLANVVGCIPVQYRSAELHYGPAGEPTEIVFHKTTKAYGLSFEGFNVEIPSQWSYQLKEPFYMTMYGRYGGRMYRIDSSPEAFVTYVAIDENEHFAHLSSYSFRPPMTLRKSQESGVYRIRRGD